MSDDGSRESNSLMQRRIRAVLALDATATALTFGGAAFPWSFYSDAIAALESSLAGHPGAGRIGIVLRNRPGPLAALIATIGTGREVVTLSPHLGEAGAGAGHRRPGARRAGGGGRGLGPRRGPGRGRDRRASSRCGPDPTAPSRPSRSAGGRIRP